MFEFEKLKVRFSVSFLILALTYFLVMVFREKALEIIGSVPENFKRILDEGFLKKLSEDPEFYIVSQWNWKNLAQMIPILSIVMGFPIFAREMENETIYFLLSNSTRRRVFLEKLSAGFVSVLVLSLTAFFPLMNGVSFKVLFGYFLHTLSASVFWFSLSFTSSLFFDDQVKPLLSSLGIFAIFAILEAFKKVRMISYIGDPRIFRGAGIDICTSLRLSVASTVLLVIAYFTFRKREF